MFKALLKLQSEKVCVAERSDAAAAGWGHSDVLSLETLGEAASPLRA